MPNPTLSICIPTFNRAACLRQCLESIASQFTDAEISSKVEVVISDNHSEDATAEVAAEFKAKYPNIAYKKNSANLGLDKNILQAVEMSRGQYVWFLGDDDAMFSDSLLYVLNLLQRPAAEYFIVNCWGYNKSLTQKALNRPNLDLSEDQCYGQLSDYIKSAKHDKNLVGLFCGLSMQIFSRDKWMSCRNKEQYIGTSAAHMFILLLAMKQEKFCILAKPCVKVRADNIRWDVFEGLGSIDKRAKLTQTGLLWILKEYNIPYSKVKFKIALFWDIFTNTLRAFMRKYVLKSQKSRDFLKKILGKL